jgi:hypothetical protein
MRKLWLLIMLVGLVLVTPVLAQDADSDLCFEQGGLIDEETGRCQLHALLEINVDFPLDYADFPFVMERLDTLIDTEVQGFMTMFVESGIAPSWTGWGLNMTYSEVRHSDTVFTVIFDEYLYTGGAHGIPLIYTLTFDTEAEKELTLDDVFVDVEEGLTAVVPFAKAQIKKVLGDFADEDWIADGTSPDNELNYMAWALSDEGILFYFGAYQVAPYAAGTQTVMIPYAGLSHVLEPEFVPKF